MKSTIREATPLPDQGIKGARLPSVDVVVAGGGLSGLACAEAISREAPEASVLCLEAGSRAGGCIQSVRAGGFLIESGPAGFLDKTGALTKLVEELGLSDQLLMPNSSDRSRWILHRGRLTELPSSLASLATSDLLSVRGKLRVMLEPLKRFRDPSAADETVGAFASRRLGAEAAEILVNPILSGIYAADADQVSLRASLPHLAGLEKNRRSLLSALLSGGKARPIRSFKDGCGQLIDALERRLEGRIALESPITTVDRDADGYVLSIGGPRPRRLRCRALISAAPASAASRYLNRIDPHIAQQLAQVRYASIAVVALGFRSADVPHALGGFGYLVPRREDCDVLGVQWSSSIYPGHRAPDDTCLLRLFLGGAIRPMLAAESEDSLAAIALAEVRRTLRVSAAPIAMQVNRHLGAMPQYLLDHDQRVADIERRLERHAGLFIGGNGLRGLGMDALVRDANRQTEAVVRFLSSSVAISRASRAQGVS